MSLLTGGRQRKGATPQAGGSASAGGRGTGRVTAAVARGAVRVADAPLPGGGPGLAHSRALDLAPLVALTAPRPGLWIVAGGALAALGVAAAIALATGRLGPLARIDLAVVAATGLAVTARRVRSACGAGARAGRRRADRRGR